MRRDRRADLGERALRCGASRFRSTRKENPHRAVRAVTLVCTPSGSRYAGRMTDWQAFTVEIDDHVARVTLTGPGKGNAMGPDFWKELPEIMAQLDTDPQVRAVVLTGSGKHFSYGLDLPAMSGTFGPLMADRALAAPRTDFLKEIRRLQASINSVADCSKPVIAAIAGWCI